MSAGSGPLGDIRVVELATWVAGPGCAGLMADWGADVVKIESPAGDPVRGFYPDTDESPGNPVFTMENRGKRSIVLDLSEAEARAALDTLLAGADVFVTNLRPGALRRAGLDYPTLSRQAPRLVYASVSGVGLLGPEADAPAFDITTFWSKSGVGRAMIPTDQEPFPCRPAFGDHTTALATLSAVLAALRARDRTGQGQLVECSLLRTAAYVIGWDLSVLLRYGEVTTAAPRDSRPSPLGGYFATQDGRWICLVAKSPRCIPSLLRLASRLDLAEAWSNLGPSPDLVAPVRAVLDTLFAGWTLAEAAGHMDQVDLAWAELRSLEDLVASDQATTSGCFLDVSDGRGGSMRSPAGPARFNAEPPPETARPGAPRLGADTRAALIEAGVARDVADRLASRIG